VKQPTAYACLGSSMCLVGAYVAMSRPLAVVFPVLLLAWLRFGIGALAMLPWLRRREDEAELGPRGHALLFLQSLFGNFLFSICMLYGVGLTSAVTAGTTMAAIPALVALMGWVFLRERLSGRTCFAIACAVAGIALYSLSKSELPTPVFIGLEPDLPAKWPWLGQVLLLGAAGCEAAYAVIGKSLSVKVRPKRIAALINLWGLALATPGALWLALSFDFSAVSRLQWLMTVIYALAASVWSVWLWMTGLQLIPVSRAGVFTVFLPLSAALTGVAVLDEPIGRMDLIAFSIALLGVAIATLPHRAKPSSTTHPSSPP
jgi:drug/metabolite transporter (DMT)-like permease